MGTFLVSCIRTKGGRTQRCVPVCPQMRNVPISHPAPLSLNLRDRARRMNALPHPFGGWPSLYKKEPSLSRARLQTLPFFCLSVSGRKLAPSAPSLKRVSRTESGQLASGWHHSSPFPDGRAERFMKMRRTTLQAALICSRRTGVRRVPSRRTTRAKRPCAPPRSPASRPTSTPMRAALDKLLDDGPRIHRTRTATSTPRRRSSTSLDERHARLRLDCDPDDPEPAHLRRRRRDPRHGEGDRGGSTARHSDLTIGYTDVWVWKDGRWQMTAWRSHAHARRPGQRVGQSQGS